MHRWVRDKVEDILASGHTGDRHGLNSHVAGCAECRSMIAAMRDQQRLLRSLRVPEEAEPFAEPSAGFYARVIERIEAQGAVSIWNLFFDSRAGRGLAMASMVLALSLGVYLVSSERYTEPDAGQTSVVFGSGPESNGILAGAPDRNAVLVNLVTYREQ